MNTVELEIFKAGRRKSSKGKVRTYSTADLDQAVEVFNPAVYCPPLIFSHKTPKEIPEAELYRTKFAFGVPQALKRVGDTLKGACHLLHRKMGYNW